MRCVLQKHLKVPATEENLTHKLLLVGDKPSKKNANPRIAFVGTVSGKRLMQWFLPMFPNKPQISMVNRTDPDFSVILIRATLKGYKIIALGDNAAKALAHAGVYNFFKLPHPSGRNRLLNNKEYVDEVLLKCKLWIQG